MLLQSQLIKSEKKRDTESLLKLEGEGPMVLTD